MSDSKKWINNLAEVRKGQDEGTFYIKVKKDVVLEKGRTLSMKSIEDHIDGLVGAGVLTQAEGKKELAEKDYVKYVLSAAPLKEQS